jgi:hypothetical protein
MSAEFYTYATDKIKKEKQVNQVAKENKKAKTKQTQDLGNVKFYIKLKMSI